MGGEFPSVSGSVVYSSDRNHLNPFIEMICSSDSFTKLFSISSRTLYSNCVLLLLIHSLDQWTDLLLCLPLPTSKSLIDCSACHVKVSWGRFTRLRRTGSSSSQSIHCAVQYTAPWANAASDTDKVGAAGPNKQEWASSACSPKWFVLTNESPPTEKSVTPTVFCLWAGQGPARAIFAAAWTINSWAARQDAEKIELVGDPAALSRKRKPEVIGAGIKRGGTKPTAQSHKTKDAWVRTIQASIAGAVCYFSSVAKNSPCE